MRIIVILLLAFTASAVGQNATKRSFNFEKKATINLAETADDWDISLQHMEAPKPGISGLRAELMAKKRKIMQRYPKSSASSPRSAVSSEPSIGHSFEGNIFGNRVPTDNDMAISKDGKIISVTNSRLYLFEAETEEQILFRSLGIFSSDLGVNGSKYDPKVIYDPNNDRFIIIFLNGFTWETSNIILGFSQTNDPEGEWNLYALPGNPLDNETWSDYPVVGISGKDLFIGINTFLNGSQNNSGFVETCLWQVGLKEGYIGFDLNTNYYSDILPQNKAIFNICPIPSAEPENENIYLLSNRNTDAQNDTVFLLEVTGRVSNPNTELEVRVLEADQPYVLPVPADQPGSHWLDTNDGRVLGGYYLNGRIYYVQSCTDPNNGRSAIYHGIIDDVEGNASIVSRIYSQQDLDYGYPNISWSGQSENDEQSIISFMHSSESILPGFSAFHVDENLERSDRVEIQEGLSIINVLTDTLERWGDYSGTQRMYNEPGVVWTAGSFGNGTNNGHGTWIAELRSPNLPTSVDEATGVQETRVFPNPIIESTIVQFSLKETMFVRLELIDSQGKLVQTLLEDRVRAGVNQISFNGNLLSPGVYFLNGISEGEVVFSEQVIKN